MSEKENNRITNKALDIYKHFGSRTMVQTNPETNTNNNVLQLDILKPEFVRYMKISETTLATDLFEELIDRETSTDNTIKYNIHTEITIGDNKNVFLDSLFNKRILNAQWHTGNLSNSKSIIIDSITLFNFVLPSKNFNEFNTRLSATKSPLRQEVAGNNTTRLPK